MELNIMSGVIRTRFCKTCQLEKPPKASHCQFCNNCVKNFDHHCFFIGNCIGERNHKSFLLFLFFGFLKSLFGFTTSVFSFIFVFYINYEYQINKFSGLKGFLLVVPILMLLTFLASWRKKTKIRTVLGGMTFIYIFLIVLHYVFTCILNYYENLGLHLFIVLVFFVTLAFFFVHLRTQVILIRMNVGLLVIV